MRKRPPNARSERAGLLAVEMACNALNLIWRDLLQEDVGVDGTIEIALGDFPSGKLVAAQVKSGRSYIRSEAETGFRFYPRAGDLEYWSKLSIPLFLLVHNPADGKVYWVDVAKQVAEGVQDRLATSYIEFSKSDTMNEEFAAYLRSRFDLTTYEDGEFARVRAELEAIVHMNGEAEASVRVTALDLFIEGLWGLCSKVQFHSSLLAGVISRALHDRRTEVFVRYTFSRSALYPFFTRYFNTLTKHHLASIDVGDINKSLYGKLEFPTFIASLTTNGRRFVEYLRSSSVNRIHDNQFFTLSLIPHEQIEVYQSFQVTDGHPEFGPYTDIVAISFNPYLDYYRIEHWRRNELSGSTEKIASQTVFYFELIEYIERAFGDVHKDNIVLRHLELPLTPLICWLEEWYGDERPFHAVDLSGKSNAENFGFHDELTSIMSPTGTVTITEPPTLDLPIRRLASGELMTI